MRTYVNPKSEQHADGRAEQKRIVRDILSTSKVKINRPRTRVKWSDFYQRYVAVK